MPVIVVGPLLRFVDRTSALVWVETDRPATVSVLDASARTFTVHGHHYGLVEVSGLAPGSSIAYTVQLDGVPVWPEPGTTFPPSRIRTLDDGGGDPRFTFGSCRMSVPHDAKHDRTYGVDVLRAFAHRLAGRDESEWPDVLLLLGDQVYADETSEAMQQFIGARRDTSRPPGTEVTDFDEYAELYRLAWGVPAVRWLLSTVPSAMIFDDHDIRDDWNTSQAWRDEMAATSWWPERITGGLGAYLIYQHLGNLSPSERASHPALTALLDASGDDDSGDDESGDVDSGDLLDEFAAAADKDPATTRWSYARDIGRVRLIVLDSRCGRIVEPGQRAMLDPGEWDWVAQQLESLEEIDHVLIGTSLPYVLPRGLHDLEAWNEIVADGAWGPRAARLAESMRQGIDLEHWAAFGDSFRTMAELIVAAAGRPGARRPATISFLSGDVHYSYAARISHPDLDDDASRIRQLVCSPIRNPLSQPVRYLNGLASFGVARALSALLVRRAQIPDSGLDWTIEQGPHFQNALATLEFGPDGGTVRWETAATHRDGTTELNQTMQVVL